MGRLKKKKCRHCGKLFLPDARNTKRQKYCAMPLCKKASKKDSQQRWLDKPENQNYFKGPDNVQRVQQWRKAHPGYSSRNSKTQADALQDPLIAQPAENNKDNTDFINDALQDLLTAQPAVIIGLIANFTGYALQDDIAMALRRMQQLGSDIINPKHEGGSHGTKTSNLSRTYSQSSQPVQLDRSALGP
jgi:hypothetical protein